ncbi:MAG: DNA mismatch repair protein MutS [Oscillospiraceae bacterium]|nr:DNA mismatch repair protein MutS [Oscillospiraceae bacterium]
MAEMTPMKRQYYEIKQQQPDCLLFFRLGDFYEMFDDDARTAARELDLTLTTRDRNVENPDERTPMCGVPYHAAEAYIGRLIAKGYKVAICEQMEDPALAKGLVKRDIIRIITPGTVTERSMLEEGRSNYLAAVYLEGDAGAVAFCDISTGEFCAADFPENAATHILNELGRFSPREAVLSPGAVQNADISAFLRKRLGCMVEADGGRFDADAAAKTLCAQFGAVDPAALELGNAPGAVCAAGALVAYAQETQKTDLSHLNRPELFGESRYMELDYTTRRNLELTESLRSGEKKGSLLWVLDQTKTPMGGRMLRAWVERPLLGPVQIKRRHAAVGELARDNVLRGETMQCLREIGDMQRLIARAVYGSANGRDLAQLASCCRQLPKLSGLLSNTESGELRAIAGMDALSDLEARISEAICDEPPFSVREGGILREGFDPEVDRLRSVRDNGASMVAELEQRERERTGIKKLKLGFNRVFGYYIDVPNSAGDVPLPEEYIRKQTLVSSERYFTPELKELENTLLTARERIAEIEYQRFNELRLFVAGEVARVQAAADLVARLDVFCSLAEVAVRNRYVCPEVDLSQTLDIKEGRHPVVEQAQKDVLFVPNDTFLNGTTDRCAIVTGPNMAGKSTYMRQTALIVLMAQIGSFVPAKSALIGVVDRVFTRIGASDDLAAGQSTFMVEMSETAAILKQATAKSLLILDEIGRGTSTYDGMAIARAVLEYCADRRKLGAKTMFATHYHELTVLERELEGVRNYNITAKKQGGTLLFLRKIVRGAADDSYGIEVAKLAGLPESVVTKAKGYLKSLETAQPSAAPAVPAAPAENDQVSLMDVGGSEIARELLALDLNTLTPIEALNTLYQLQKKAKG